MRWADDGWPRIGDNAGTGPGTPVRSHPVPVVGSGGSAADVPANGPAPADVPAPPSPATGDDLATGQPGPHWYWPANPRSSWWSPGRPEGLRLTCVRSTAMADLRELPNVLGQRLPAAPATVSTTMTLHSDLPGARAGLTILGRGYAWLGQERTATGIALVHRTAVAPGAGGSAGVGGFEPSAGPAPAETDLARPVPLPAGQRTAVLRVHLGPGAVCRFAAAPGQDPPVPLGIPFVASPGHWVGATLGLFATAPPGEGPAGHAEITRFTVVGG